LSVNETNRKRALIRRSTDFLKCWLNNRFRDAIYRLSRQFFCCDAQGPSVSEEVGPAVLNRLWLYSTRVLPLENPLHFAVRPRPLHQGRIDHGLLLNCSSLWRRTSAAALSQRNEIVYAIFRRRFSACWRFLLKGPF